MAWLYVGVGITAVVLGACAVWTMLTLRAIAMPAGAHDLQLHVTGELVAGEKGKTAGTIRAESIEVIHGRKARSDIQQEKVKLAEMQ